MKARDRLILAYSPLVKYVAGRMGNGLPSHIEEADLISYGLLGLISALERFDPAREIKFETYAISRIKGSIIDELRSLDWVPRSVRSKAREIEKVITPARAPPAPCPDRRRDRRRARHHRGRVPADPDADREDVDRRARRALGDLGVGRRSGVAHRHARGPEGKDPSRMLDLSEMKSRLAVAIDALPDRERIVIALYYYENLTLREIGEVLGVTESRVSQLHTKAILRLKGRLRDEIEPAAIG